MDYESTSAEKILREEKKLLLHSCCASCSGAIMVSLQEEGIALTVLYYNPNIYPRDEYLKRKYENMRFAKKQNIPFVDLECDSQNWHEKIHGLENEPERGKRCSRCFDIRLIRTARYAQENNFKVFATSLGLSRWKNIDQVNQSGMLAAATIPGLTFWANNFRKNGGSQRSLQISRDENFYRQKYCGCLYSFKTHESNHNCPTIVTNF